MALQDQKYNEVRVRNGSKLQQIPNYVTAGEQLANGQFVKFGDNGQFHLVNSPTDRATHLVQRSGIARVTIDEISHNVGIVLPGEPVMAYTGEGRATIPFAESVTAGEYLTVENGYAVGWDSDEYGTIGYTIGQAVNDVTIPQGQTLAWGDAILNLPAQYI